MTCANGVWWCDHSTRPLQDVNVFLLALYDPTDRLSAACDLGDHVVSLGVMSKTYGLAGLRIGWIATQNVDVQAKMAMLKIAR